MKQTIAFIMAIAVLACTLSMTSFAATDIKYPVSGISSQAYVLDDDGKLSLTSSYATDKVRYGKAAYFPLLSSNSNAVNSAKTAWENAKTAKTTADNDFKVAETNYNTAYNALTQYDEAKTANATEQGKLENYKTKIVPLTTELNLVKPLQEKAQQDHKDALAVQAAKAWETTVDSGEWVTYIKKAQDDVDKTQIELNLKNAALDKAQQDINNLGNLTDLTNAATAAYNTFKAKETALFSATGNTASESAAKSAVEARKVTMQQAKDKQDAAAKLVETTDKAYKDAQANSYKYVYEPDAIDNARVTAKWEENGNYASVDLVKKRVQNTINGATSSMQSIYFLEVKIKSSSSTQDRDLLGKVTLRKSGSNGYEVTTDIALELGYSSASSSEGEIPKTPKTFKEGSGFDAESDYVFDFEADGNSRFEVSTVGQGSLVLGFNTEYDDDIGDDYPNADIEFFNGNYASFNRVGTLYLGSTNDGAYVYEISKSGQLTRIDPEYDESEEAYVIRTRTLGRYVISNTKLKTTSSSSSSSSSGTGTGAGTGTGTGGTGTTVVPVTSSPSYTYTPPKPPAASSSTAPPAQSSSSEEPEEESQSESEPEELEDEDDIVDVVIDDEDAEGPEEKSGIPVWVWVLIIVGLAAIPIGIGVVYYLHSRPLRRDFFNKEEDEYEYDDDDDED